MHPLPMNAPCASTCSMHMPVASGIELTSPIRLRHLIASVQGRIRRFRFRQAVL